MSDMKLIMERWDKFRLDERLAACEKGMTIGVMEVATEIQQVLGDAEAQKKKLEQIKQSKWRKYLPSGVKIAKFLEKVGVEGVGGAIGGAAVGPFGASAGAAIAGLFVKASQQEDKIAGPYQQFLELFCVDSETLDLIEDKYQKAYVTESDIVDEIQAYVQQGDANTPLPDVTQHLTNWLNTKSDYAKADTDVVPKE